jgi:hypothetical protein
LIIASAPRSLQPGGAGAVRSKLDLDIGLHVLLAAASRTPRHSRYCDHPPDDPCGVVGIERMEHFAIDVFEFFPIRCFVLLHKLSFRSAMDGKKQLIAIDHYRRIPIV